MKRGSPPFGGPKPRGKVTRRRGNPRNSERLSALRQRTCYGHSARLAADSQRFSHSAPDIRSVIGLPACALAREADRPAVDGVRSPPSGGPKPWGKVTRRRGNPSNSERLTATRLRPTAAEMRAIRRYSARYPSFHPPCVARFSSRSAEKASIFSSRCAAAPLARDPARTATDRGSAEAFLVWLRLYKCVCLWSCVCYHGCVRTEQFTNTAISHARAKADQEREFIAAS